METRANYVIVGIFTLLVGLGITAFLLWVGGRGQNKPMVEYDISFNESVKGLSVNNDVLFTGIRVGKVTDIKISRVTPGEVRVRISIDADTPVREDSVAQLEPRGITGISIVSISGGTAQSPLIRVDPGQVGVIRYEPSPLSSVVAQMPDVLTSTNQILQRVEIFFSKENAAAFTNILASLSEVSGALAARTDSINAILIRAEKSSAELETLLATANTVFATDIKSTSAAVKDMARRGDAIFAAMQPGLKQFSTQGLADMRVLIVELRNMAQTLTRLGQAIENEPRRFLFGNTVQEYHNR